MSTQTLRLDQLLVNLNLVASRSRARDAISRGTVKVDGNTVVKRGLVVAAIAAIEVDDRAIAVKAASNVLRMRSSSNPYRGFWRMLCDIIQVVSRRDETSGYIQDIRGDGLSASH